MVKVSDYRYCFRKFCHKDKKCGMVTLIFRYIISVYLMHRDVATETLKSA